MSEVTSFTLRLDGKPQGKPRARFRPGQKPYPDRKQKLAEGEIRRVWQEAGSPRLIDGPLRLDVWLYVSRSTSHFRQNGSLSAEGSRCPYPHKQKPDADNALKLVCDALNGLAWRDDVRFVDMHCSRRWSDWPGTTIDVVLLQHAGDAQHDKREDHDKEHDKDRVQRDGGGNDE